MDRGSQRAGFGQYALLQKWAHALWRDDIHPSSQQGFCILLEADEIQQGSFRREIDQEVDIAAWFVLSPHNGAEDAYPRGAMPRGERQQIAAMAN